MSHDVGSTFDSIESAHEFVTLLAEAVLQAKREIELDVQRESSAGYSRRAEALQITLYSLQKLELHTHRSGRILNDLRSLRRLLFEERTAGLPTVHAKSTGAARTQPKATVAPLSPPSPVNRPSAAPQSAAA